MSYSTWINLFEKMLEKWRSPISKVSHMQTKFIKSTGKLGHNKKLLLKIMKIILVVFMDVSKRFCNLHPYIGILVE